MARSIVAACAALALAGAGALAQSIGSAPSAGPAGASSSSANQPAPPQRAAPSRPSKPMSASTPGSGTEQDAAASTTLPDPANPPTAAATTRVGGSGSSGLGAMGGGIDVTASPTNQMGSGNLMPDCPMGMVRHLGLCVTYDQARRAQMPKPQR